MNSAFADANGFQISSEKITLQGNFTRSQLQVTETGPKGNVTDRSVDLTTRAKYASSNPKVVHVDETGRMLAVGNGEAVVSVSVGKTTKQVQVIVTGVVSEPKTDFDYHIRPILSKAGCNMGACHATQYGKGGFKLSVFGFEPDEDHEAMIRDRQQRRVNFLDPEASLLLKKPSMQIPHGGGRRLTKDSVDYQILTAWIRSGAPAPRKDAAKVVELHVTPKQRVGKSDMTQQLKVEAVYSDGTRKDVTAWAKYDSMDEALLSVDTAGRVRVVGKGQAPIMVRVEGQAQISTFVIPYAKSVKLAGWKNNNFVDELPAKKFRQLGIEP